MNGLKVRYMQISEHFTLDELIDSEAGTRLNIEEQFTPSDAVVQNLKKLCVNILEPLRDIFKAPIIISSGYRCPRVNKAIGGSRTSQHIEGKAVDFKVIGYTVEEVFKTIVDSGVLFDQCIQEFNKWVHISYDSKRVRREKIRATKGSKRNTVYTKI